MKARGSQGDAREGDAGIDGLYQLPLEAFTAARNALARQLPKRAAEIKALTKPAVAAWAVNQLYWHQRPLYDALVDAAQHLRLAHAAVLGGKAADVRAAGKAHEARVSAALDAALQLLAAGGHAAGDTVRQPVMTTLRALPAGEAPGRLTRVLQPGGFESLAGLSIRGVKVPRAAPPPPKPVQEVPRKKRPAADPKALARAREEVATAIRVLKDAQHAAQREEFERARAARDADQAARAVTRSREALEEAETALQEAAAAEAAAKRKREAAEQRAANAEETTDAARTRVTAAQRQLESLNGKN
ncbi:MAG: hypothetical protein ABIQ52_09980 [Vicinamibacterales bacterium]